MIVKNVLHQDTQQVLESSFESECVYSDELCNYIGVAVKSELKRGYSRLLANASGLCERIRVNDVEIQCRESTSFDLEVCGEKFLLCRPYLGFKRVGLTGFGRVRYHVSGRFSGSHVSMRCKYSKFDQFRSGMIGGLDESGNNNPVTCILGVVKDANLQPTGPRLMFLLLGF
ncbi:hypothetical protein Tco_1133977 [Tanacetum coccineum]